MEWGTLIPVIVGGLLTLAGGLIGPWALERKKEAAEKRKKRAEKFEELVAAVYEFDHWIDKLKRVYAFGETGEYGVSPFAKLHAISRVYFPQFEKAISELDAAADAYKVWMMQAGQKRTALKIESLNEGFLDVLNPYVKKREELLSQLNKLAREEFR
jgi:hypothetical protein